MPQRFRVDVSLESIEGPAKAYHGEIVAANARLGVRRALEAAIYAYPRAHWRNCVVILERVDDPSAPEGA